MFANPGGPGDTGVGLVQGDPDGLDALGDGRFDVLSWDPRGTHASTRVKCFTSQRSESRFWAGVSIPTTKAESEGYKRTAAAYARRCGEVSGWLLPHISTADTVRDLEHLRVLMGEEKLTYLGLSYGTYLGQTYANMFGDRIRAMMLNGIVDPVAYSKGSEARLAATVRPSDAVYDQFLALCDSAGPERCALAGGRHTAAERFDRLSARLKRAPIPAPGAQPPLSAPQKLGYADLLISQFHAIRAPRTWPTNAANLAAALRGDGSTLESAAGASNTPGGWALITPSTAIQCADASAHRRLRAWPSVIARFARISRLQGALSGWWQWAPCAAWPVRGEDTYRGPWTASTPNPVLVINTPLTRIRLCQRRARRAAPGQRGPDHPGGLRSPELPEPERLRQQGDYGLPDRADHPAEWHGLPVRSAALRSGFPLGPRPPFADAQTGASPGVTVAPSRGLEARSLDYPWVVARDESGHLSDLATTHGSKHVHVPVHGRRRSQRASDLSPTRRRALRPRPTNRAAPARPLAESEPPPVSRSHGR